MSVDSVKSPLWHSDCAQSALLRRRWTRCRTGRRAASHRTRAAWRAGGSLGSATCINLSRSTAYPPSGSLELRVSLYPKQPPAATLEYKLSLLLSYFFDQAGEVSDYVSVHLNHVHYLLCLMLYG